MFWGMGFLICGKNYKSQSALRLQLLEQFQIGSVKAGSFGLCCTEEKGRKCKFCLPGKFQHCKKLR